MAREWKPGDVALVTDARGNVRRAVRGETRNSHTPCWWLMDTFTWVTSVGNARPLLVIDPEDREQVERLLSAIDECPMDSAGDDVTEMQAILRSMLDPKPDEPTGLGAVVRDREGVLWVRAEKAKGMQNPWQDTLNSVASDDRIRAAAWSDIDVASTDDILSAGVKVDR